jgi:hypothetical protein
VKSEDGCLQAAGIFTFGFGFGAFLLMSKINPAHVCGAMLVLGILAVVSLGCHFWLKRALK